MSRAFLFRENELKRCPSGLPFLFVDAVVSTAGSYLGEAFDKPRFFQVSKPWGDTLKDFIDFVGDHLKNHQVNLLALNCKTKVEFENRIRLAGFHTCPKSIVMASTQVFDLKPATDRPLADTIAGVFESRGLHSRAAALRENKLVEPLKAETVEMIFQKFRDPRGGNDFAHNFNESEKKATLTGQDNREIRHTPNFITRIIHDGFGELKENVKVRFHKDVIDFFWKDRLVHRGSADVKQLELFRDAAAWIWMNLLLHHHQATPKEESKFKIPWLKAYKREGTGYNVLESNSMETESSASDMNTNNVETASQKIEGEEINFVDKTSLMPGPSDELLPVVSALKAAGFEDEADKFVRNYPIVPYKAPGKKLIYDILTPGGVRWTSASICIPDNAWYWYYILMEKLQRSRLFKFPEPSI